MYEGCYINNDALPHPSVGLASVHPIARRRLHGVSALSSLPQDRCVAVLGRVEKTEFLSPMFIGEVAHVCAEITYTSEHSVEVQVHVMSENVLTGKGEGRSSMACMTE